MIVFNDGLDPIEFQGIVILPMTQISIPNPPPRIPMPETIYVWTAVSVGTEEDPDHLQTFVDEVVIE